MHDLIRLLDDLLRLPAIYKPGHSRLSVAASVTSYYGIGGSLIRSSTHNGLQGEFRPPHTGVRECRLQSCMSSLCHCVGIDMVARCTLAHPVNSGLSMVQSVDVVRRGLHGFSLTSCTKSQPSLSTRLSM